LLDLHSPATRGSFLAHLCILYEKPYYMTPGKGGEKPYRLLLKALEESKSVGIAEFMLRNRMHVCAVKAYNNVLLLNQMRYKDEIREMPAIESKDEKISPKEVALAVQLIKQLSEDFDPAAFKDTYLEELEKLIQAKAAGKQIRVASEPKKATATVKDLMSVLKESLSQSKKTA